MTGVGRDVALAEVRDELGDLFDRVALPLEQLLVEPHLRRPSLQDHRPGLGAPERGLDRGGEPFDVDQERAGRRGVALHAVIGGQDQRPLPAADLTIQEPHEPPQLAVLDLEPVGHLVAVGGELVPHRVDDLVVEVEQVRHLVVAEALAPNELLEQRGLVRRACGRVESAGHLLDRVAAPQPVEAAVALVERGLRLRERGVDRVVVHPRRACGSTGACRR